MKLLTDLTLDEIKEAVISRNQSAFRAGQLYKWITLGADYAAMTDLPAEFRAELSKEYAAVGVKIIKTLCSRDGSKKFLFEFNDGETAEGVFMPHDYGDTLCASTQVGCRMGCAFCASGLNGLARNLSAGEILGQVIAVNAVLSGEPDKRKKLSNIVLMGSGEPLDNYENVTKFISLVTSPNGLNIGRRSVSLSTCGLAPEIRRLADDGFSVTLSVSLHATADEARRALMPIAKKYSLTELLDAVKYYFDKTGRRIIFEYCLIKESNMNFFDAQRLAEITRGFASHVNLIMLNRVPEKNVSGCTKADADRFLDKLVKLGVSATLRRSMGSDIGGACGQLRRKFVGDKK
jgi:23S rRNA (adenine2503-C2)-methyltransferase